MTFTFDNNQKLIDKIMLKISILEEQRAQLAEMVSHLENMTIEEVTKEPKKDMATGEDYSQKRRDEVYDKIKLRVDRF